VEAADISTQDRDVQTNHFKTNLPIVHLSYHKSNQNLFPTTIVSPKGDRESHWGTETKKARGGDQITPKMLIELPNSAIEVICKIFNGIITLGNYPKKWKKSLIIMIPKPGKDHTIPSSYRPISALSCLSKLFEKCLLTRIIPFLGAHNVIPAHQLGFRQNHGTIEQVNRITSEIRTAFEHWE